MARRDKEKVMISAKLDPEQVERIDRLVEREKRSTGFNLNRSDLIRKLVAVALPKLEAK